MLLTQYDPCPVLTVNQDSLSSFLFVCDHAGYQIPVQLHELGLSPTERYRHIAWDIGIKKVGLLLSDLLGATFIAQTYSRLVIDCNRGLNNSTLISEISDELSISGNQNLSQDQRQSRITDIYEPYHQMISQLINNRIKSNTETFFISLHSFTPQMRDGYQRPWHAGILHGQNNQFSMIFKKILENNYSYPIGDNQPYALTEKNDYTVPTHAFKRNLPYLELELRQDLITTDEQQQEWAKRLFHLLPLALQEYKILCG